MNRRIPAPVRTGMFLTTLWVCGPILAFADEPLMPRHEAIIDLRDGIQAQIIDCRLWDVAQPRWSVLYRLTESASSSYQPWKLDGKTLVLSGNSGRAPGDVASVRSVSWRTVLRDGEPKLMRIDHSEFSRKIVHLGHPARYSPESARAATQSAEPYLDTRQGQFLEVAVMFRNSRESRPPRKPEERPTEFVFCQGAGAALDIHVLGSGGDRILPRDFLPCCVGGNTIDRLRSLESQSLTFVSELVLRERGQFGFALAPGERTWALFLFEIPRDADLVRVQLCGSRPVPLALSEDPARRKPSDHGIMPAGAPAEGEQALPFRITPIGFRIEGRAFRPGDRVVTTAREAPLTLENGTPLTLKYGSDATVWQVRGDKILITAEQNGKNIKGWIDPGNVASAQNTAKFSGAMLKGGIEHHLRGEIPEAVAHYTAVIRCDPQKKTAYYNRARAHRAGGYLDLAIQDYTAAIKVDPRFSRAYVGRGAAYARRGELDRAVADYARAIELDPEDRMAYENLALALEARGDTDAAKVYSEVARELKLSERYNELLNKQIQLADREHKTASEVLTCDLAEAASEGFIRVTGQGEDIQSAHLRAESMLKKPLQLCIVPGLQIVASNSHQNMVTWTRTRCLGQDIARRAPESSELFLDLRPLASEVLSYVPVVCMNARRGTPDQEDRYCGVSRVEGILKQFLERMDEEKTALEEKLDNLYAKRDKSEEDKKQLGRLAAEYKGLWKVVQSGVWMIADGLSSDAVCQLLGGAVSPAHVAQARRILDEIARTKQ